MIVLVCAEVDGRGPFTFGKGFDGPALAISLMMLPMSLRLLRIELTFQA